MDTGSLATPSFALVEAFASNTLLWIVTGLLAYWVAIVALRQRGLLPEYVGTQGPVLTLHTKRGRVFLDWLARPKRFWRAWANLGVGTALVVMAGTFLMLVTAAIGSIRNPQPATAVNQPRNVLVIPGVNDFLPLSVAPEIVFGLLVGLVVHEGGHGLLCRVEDIDIRSMGLALLAIVPIGAFVEPDEENRARASRGSQTRMFAAGVTNNFAVTVVAFALLFGPVVGAIGVAPGAAVGGVVPDSPAEESGIGANDRITAVDGRAVENNDQLGEYLEESDEEAVTVEIDGKRTTTVERSLLVTASVEDGPVDVQIGDRIVGVDGDSVATERGFRTAIEGEETVTLTLERTVDGETERFDRVMPVGAYALVDDDGPLASAGAAPGTALVITEFDGERVTSYDEFEAAIGETESGDEVTVAGYVDGERVSYDVILGENPQSGAGLLGIQGAQGVSGLSVNDFGVQLYPSQDYLTLLGGDGDGSLTMPDSFLLRIAFALFLPLVSLMPGFPLPFNFAGFTGGVQNFYQVEGSLAILGDGGVFLLANLLFWTGWINVQLAFFNCIPAFPLDGGHILRTSTEAIVSRLPFEATRGVVRTVTTAVGITMLISLILMLFGPQLFAS